MRKRSLEEQLRRKKRQQRKQLQTRPWSVQLEFTEGCNRHCSFCGLQRLRPGGAMSDNRFMAPETVERVARGMAALCPQARIELAMHGEPTLHPAFLDNVRTLRAHLPTANIMLTTNGRKWYRHFHDRAMEAFEAGLNLIVVDTYEPERLKLQARIKECRPPITVLDFFAELADSDPMFPWKNHHGAVQCTVVILDDISLRQEGGRNLLNLAGNNPDAPVPDEPIKATCERPFRDLTVAYNGNVNLCCNDWGHEYVCGNVNQQSLEEIWHGPRFQAARRFLQVKERGFSPCDRCDARYGSRIGLLPDPGPPTARDVQAIREAQAHNTEDKNRLERRILPQVMRYEEG